MTRSTGERAQGAQEHPCSKTARGRTQQRNYRCRWSTNGACPAVRDAGSRFNSDVNITSNNGLAPSSCAWMENPASMVVESLANNEYNRSRARQPEGVDSLSLVNSPAQCTEVTEKLESGSNFERHNLLLQLHKATRQLALSKTGCRIVQKAIEVASAEDRELIIAELKDHVTELYESPHGNHVLSRAIEVLPAAKNSYIISALLGQCITVAKHRYGCRVLCRLIEHCTEEHIGLLLDEVTTEAGMLALHAYGNFVIQTMLEHTSPARRSAVLSRVLPSFAALSMHRTGSLVAQRVLDYCDAVGQNSAVHVLLAGKDDVSLVDVACSRYGSFVLEQLAGMFHTLDSVQAAAQVLASDLPNLHSSEHARRVIVAFRLAPVETLDC